MSFGTALGPFPPDCTGPMTLTGQDDPLLRRSALRGPGALVPQDPARGGGGPHRRRRHRREDLPGEARLPAHRGHQRGPDRGGATSTAWSFPGGYAPDIMRRSPKLLQLTREIYDAGKPVAFICHAGWVPISAGIVRGERGTSVGAIKDDLVNAGMLWEDSPVVVDGNLISSRTPADLPEFMRALIGAFRRQRIERPAGGPPRPRRADPDAHVPRRDPAPGGRLDQPVRGGLLPSAHQPRPADAKRSGSWRGRSTTGSARRPRRRRSRRAISAWRWRTSSSC